MVAAQLVATARRVGHETGYAVWSVLDPDRIAASLGEPETDELAVADALRLVISCLDDLPMRSRRSDSVP
jgi:hypothetical protein